MIFTQLLKDFDKMVAMRKSGKWFDFKITGKLINNEWHVGPSVWKFHLKDGFQFFGVDFDECDCIEEQILAIKRGFTVDNLGLFEI